MPSYSSRKALTIGAGALLLGFLVWLLLPRSVDRIVSETFPMSGGADPAESTDKDSAATEELGEGAPGADHDLDSGLESENSPASGRSESAGEVRPSTPAPGPVGLLSGAFHDIDESHRGSGEATIYRLEDGRHSLRLESLDVTKGPDLFVILSPHPDPSSEEEVHSEGYVQLAELKGNRGDQNYAIPAHLDPSDFRSVVIYCRRFSVLFSVAPLQ